MSDSKVRPAIAWCERMVKGMGYPWRHLFRSQSLAEAPPVPIHSSVDDGSVCNAIAESDCLYSFRTPVQAVRVGSAPPVAFILGHARSGKSVALRQAAFEYAREFLAEYRRARYRVAVPAYVNLSEWRQDCASHDDLEGWLLSCRSQVGAEEDLIWFLDELDRLPATGPLSVDMVIDTAWRKAGPEDCFIFASRPTPDVLARSDALESISRIWLGSLVKPYRWVKKYCPEALSALCEFEATHEQGKGFLSNPLLFSLVLSNCLDTEMQPQSQRDYYPGRAGVFHSFMSRVLDLAVRHRRLSLAERRVYEERHAKVVNAAFWSALEAGRCQHVPRNKVEDYITKALPSHPIDRVVDDWTKGIAILEKAGLVIDAADEQGWRSIHPLFAEYWAACHLANRFANAKEAGHFKAELSRRIEETRFDWATAQALAMTSTQPRQSDVLQAAFQITCEWSLEDAVCLVARTGSTRASDIILNTATSCSPDTAEKVATGLGRAQTSLAARVLARMLQTTERARDRFELVAALGQLRGYHVRGCDEPLLTCLCSSDEIVRRLAVQALGFAPLDGPVLEALLKRLRDPVESVGLKVLDLLHEQELPLQAIPVLRELREDQSLSPRMLRAVEVVLRGVTERVSKFKRLHGGIVAERKRRSLRVDVHNTLEEAREELSQQMSLASVMKQREAAAQALEDQWGTEEVEALVIMLRFQRDASLRSASFEDVQTSVSRLHELLKHDESSVRQGALLGLALLPCPQAAAAVASVLSDPVHEVRGRSADVLGRMNHLDSVGPLVNALGDEDVHVRATASESLGLLVKRGIVGFDDLMGTCRSNGAGEDALRRVAQDCGRRLQPLDHTTPQAEQRQKREAETDVRRGRKEERHNKAEPRRGDSDASQGERERGVPRRESKRPDARTCNKWSECYQPELLEKVETICSTLQALAGRWGMTPDKFKKAMLHKHRIPYRRESRARWTVRKSDVPGKK